MRGAVGTDSKAVAVPLVSEVYGNAVGLPRFDKKNSQRCQQCILVSLSHFGPHVIMLNRFPNNNPVPSTSMTWAVTLSKRTLS